METVFTQSPCGSQSQSQSGSQFTSHDRNHNRGLKVVRAVTISVIKVSHHSQSQSFFSSDSDCGSSKGSCSQWSQSRIIVLVTILVAVIVLISVADCARPVFFEPCSSDWDDYCFTTYLFLVPTQYYTYARMGVLLNFPSSLVSY